MLLLTPYNRRGTTTSYTIEQLHIQPHQTDSRPPVLHFTLFFHKTVCVLNWKSIVPTSPLFSHASLVQQILATTSVHWWFRWRFWMPSEILWKDPSCWTPQVILSKDLALCFHRSVDYRDTCFLPRTPACGRYCNLNIPDENKEKIAHKKIYICFKCCCTFVYAVTCIAFWCCCMVELIAPMFDFVVGLFLLVQTVPNPWTPMLLLPMILLLASKEILLPCTSSLWPPTNAGPSQRPLCAFVGICVFKPKNN